MDQQHEATGLPVYTPSSALPTYNSDLSHGESLLDYTPQVAGVRRAPTSLFVKKDGKTTIILYNQEEGVQSPTYGRGGNVTGHLLLEQSDNILEVLIKIKGALHTTISEGTAQSQTLDIVDTKHVIWTPSKPQEFDCPEQLSFLVSLPTTFNHSGTSFPLPPTYHAEFISSESLFVWASYTLQFDITRVRHKKVDMWTKTKNIHVTFKYVPRTRPHRPILTPPKFFASIKTSPEEWHQTLAPLKTRPKEKATNDPIYCHLFVPSSRIYGLTDVIPFHIQLSGSASSLKELFSRVPPDQIISSGPRSSDTSEGPSTQKNKPLLTVSILRQVSAKIGESKGIKNTLIGESKIWPIPPNESSGPSNSTLSPTETSIDWEGETQCDSNITVGGFEAANIQVKDFIILTLSPPASKSYILPLQLTVPIRLVTESWGDVTGLDSGAV